MKTIEYPVRKDWDKIIRRPVFSLEHLEDIVKPVLEEVKRRGDQAILDLTEKFDKIKLPELLVSTVEIQEAEALVDQELKDAIHIARQNIYRFHYAQLEKMEVVETMPGVSCWRKSIAIQKVGLYIPGGSAPLFSTVLMLGIPANIAGCEEIVLCTPPDKNGKVHPAILYTASLLGVTKIIKAGGAQAIAGMAYGTETIPKTDKIFGPGNQYVTVAKQLVNRQGTAIDMPAGPSEAAVLADKSARAVFVAADLLSQAEHGMDSHVLFVTDDKALFDEVRKEVRIQVEALPRKEFALKTLENSVAVLVKDMEEGMAIMNAYAPEHLLLQVEEVERWANQVINAGSVFLGHYTPEAAGDYASGTNHTLPTNGYARMYSGVSVDSFVKKVTFQHIRTEGLRGIGPYIETMAESEGLQAHKNAVSIRLKTL